jgi:hypothetical protein
MIDNHPPATSIDNEDEIPTDAEDSSNLPGEDQDIDIEQQEDHLLDMQHLDSGISEVTGQYHPAPPIPQSPRAVEIIEDPTPPR